MNTTTTETQIAFTVAEIEAAISHVADATGTRREFVSVMFAHGGDDGWGWVVTAPMRRFTTAPPDFGPAGLQR